MALPDFKAMTPDEIAAWFETNDLSELIASGERVEGATLVQVDATGMPVEKVVTVKMPGDMVARLDHAAGRDRSGRSGIIRQAVAEWLERHPDAAA
ncbi:ribbon-helix-helix domain-containing protein [Dactylosporangium darangshiense]|uniref:Ribbon-helix-helix protein CopG domain-containing protein n=1 Tax=Dactylosporangium darangshiense TaxID=579108 RepID=A0ABP8DSH1_9ACTN